MIMVIIHKNFEFVFISVLFISCHVRKKLNYILVLFGMHRWGFFIAFILNGFFTPFNNSSGKR